MAAEEDLGEPLSDDERRQPKRQRRSEESLGEETGPSLPAAARELVANNPPSGQENQSTTIEETGQQGDCLWPTGCLIDSGDEEGPIATWALERLVTMCKDDSRYTRVQTLGNPVKDAAGGPEKSQNGCEQSDWVRATEEGSGRVFALDCEMVECEGGESRLARISLIERDQSEEGQGEARVRIDEHVKPAKPVVDLRTGVSGIRGDDIERAQYGETEARDEFLRMVGRGDFIVGHTVGADLWALGVDHANVIDTALLHGVQNAESWTLSLKDTVLAAVPDWPGASSFQAEGCSHDSVSDALWALRIAVASARRVERGEPHFPRLEAVPSRFMSQLQVKRLPNGTDENNVRSLFSEAGSPLPETAVMRPLRSGSEGFQPSTVIEFESEEEAERVFASLSGSQWPEEEGFLCKTLGHGANNNKQGGDTFVKSYKRVGMGVRLEGRISRSVLGKVIGRKGRRLQEIRRRSGCLVRIKPEGSKEATEQAVDILSDCPSKANAAVRLLVRASQGERLGV